jgi:hypothetical protein
MADENTESGQCNFCGCTTEEVGQLLKGNGTEILVQQQSGNWRLPSTATPNGWSMSRLAQTEQKRMPARFPNWPKS